MKTMIAISAAALISASAFAMPAAAQTGNEEIVPGSEPMETQDSEMSAGGAMDSTLEAGDDAPASEGMSTMESDDAMGTADGDGMGDSEDNAPAATGSTDDEGDTIVPGVTPE